MKKYIVLLSIVLGGTSCADSWLDEKMVSTITQDYFETELGLEQLIVGTYNSMRYKHGWTDGIYNFEIGHDMGVAQAGHTSYDVYSATAWASTGSVASNVNTLMGQFSNSLLGAYPMINDCNRAIQAIRSGAAQGKFASDEAYAESRMSEALFNRAFCYYMLNTMVGDVYVTTEYTERMPDSYYFPRTTSEDLYSLMIGDLRYAYEKLPETARGSDFGRATKYAAAHFLAKLYLQRAQGAEYGTAQYGRNADGTIDTSNENSYLGLLYKGKVSTDLDSCIYFASRVIDSGNYALEPNYHNIFRHGIDDYSNESSSEIIISSVFGPGAADNTRFGMRSICYFSCNYADPLVGIPTVCWEYPTSPSAGVHNNDWGFDAYTNKIADSRFQGGFRLEYKSARMGGTTSSPAANLDYYAYDSDDNATYVWTADQANYFNANIYPTYTRESYMGRRAVAGEHKIGTGDLSFAFLENTKETAIEMEEALAQPFVLYARWIKDGNKYYYRPQIAAATNTYSYNTSTFYGLENGYRNGQPTTIKYEDPNRSSYTSFYGTRDVPVFRLAETYLLRAEAYGRKEGPNSANAIADINKVRARAAFKSGDTRAEVLARLYPGSEKLNAAERQWPYTVQTDMTSEMLVDATYWNGSSANSVAEQYPPTATTDMDRFLHFIYNELGRELNQEMIYIENLHHSGLHAERIRYKQQIGSPEKGLWDTSDNTLNGTGQTGDGKGNFKNYHTIRPIPQSFIDLLTDENNNPLTDAEKKAYQNYGY